MKHPIYRDADTVQLLEGYRKALEAGQAHEFHEEMHKVLLSSGFTYEHAGIYLDILSAYLGISITGHVLIALKSASDWDESTSRKSVEKMPINMLYTPYEVYMIDLSGAKWTDFEYCTIRTVDDRLFMYFERDVKGGIFQSHVILPLIGEGVVGDFLGDDELSEQAYKVLSLNLYMLMFKKDTTRVRPIITRNAGSKKRGIPKHNTNTIYLSQPKYQTNGVKGLHHKISKGVTWLVKGHFRNQPVGKRDEDKFKTIFIDPFWKGEGAEMMRKVVV